VDMHTNCLAVLEQTPEILAHLLVGLTDGDLAWQPSPERWSIAMVLAHLADVEIAGFRARFLAIGERDNPFLPAYDPAAHFETWNEVPDAHQKLALFRESRIDTLKSLGSITKNPDVYIRTGQHEDFGQITFIELLNEFAFHDLGHTRQIMELYRSRSFYPHMGAFQRIYKTNP
jgi:hypothetical protein